jgi:periplasmic divalent cation tolerance protein
VEYRLAACVNIIPGVTSVYRWEERVETAGEALLMIKARRAEYPGLEAAIRSRHPYELPEIIAVSLSDGFAPYLSWIHTTTTE